MKKLTLLTVGLVASFIIGYHIHSMSPDQPEMTLGLSVQTANKPVTPLKLGAFSVSLSVKDLKASRQFYEILGFHVFGGSMEQNYLIMKNETTLIGLFQGMFENNLLTFNPGWNENAENLEEFDDVRDIQKRLKENNIAVDQEADEESTGPAFFMVTDPDGNVLLFDQHR